MRDINKLLSTGCVFMCLSAWSYDLSRAADTSASPMDQAVAQVINKTVTSPVVTDPVVTTPTTQPVITTGVPMETATTSPAVTPSTEPALIAATQPTTQPEGNSTNLNSAVVNVGVDGMVEQFNAQDLDINSALHFLSLQSKRNIIASKEVHGTVTANLYNVTFSEALDALLKPNGWDYVEKGNFIYVYTDKELEEIHKRERHAVNHIFKLQYINATDASVLIKPMLSSSGAIAITPASAIGLPTGNSDTGGSSLSSEDTLVVSDFAENISAIETALKDLDERPKQILVESTILNATLSDQNALGVDLVSLSGLDFSNIGSVISPITSASSSSSSSSSSSGASSVTTPGQVAGTLIPGVANNQSSVGTNFASNVPNGGLSIGFLSNHVSAYVRALETVTDTTVVANPKILTLNKQHGEVHVGGQLGYLTTSTSSTTTNQTVQFIDVGTKLVFRPFIGDNGYIRMEIHPEDSSGTVDSRGVPQTTTTEVTTNVMIKDGRTIVIGGLFRESNSRSRSQVPFVGNIPVLGNLFGSTADDVERTETIVLITPHIINDDTSMYDASKKESEDVTKALLGARAGLQPWGRERMAQIWYSKAREESEKGRKDKAIMYTDWALSMHSGFVDALRLKESLTGQQMKETVSSGIEGFVKDVVRADEASGAMNYAVPAATLAPTTMPTR